MIIKIWEARTNKGLSVRKLSRLTGISKTRLNNIENQKRHTTLVELEKIAKALNIRISDLYESRYK